MINPDFIKLMEDIDKHGLEKHGKNSAQVKLTQPGWYKRDLRLTTKAIIEHSQAHGNDYLAGVVHDHFGTKEHQLAAIAYNAMMEFCYFQKEQQLMKERMFK